MTKTELMEMSDEEDRRVLKFSELPDDFDFDEALTTLFVWMQHAFTRIDAARDKMADHDAACDNSCQFAIIKQMVPGCEYTPAVLLTSEDYNEEG